MFHSRIPCALAILAAVAFLGASCSSSGGSSGNSTGNALKGTWIGYGKEVSTESFQDSTARLDGFKVSSSGKVTEFIDSGEWLVLDSPLTISSTDNDNIFTVDGADYPTPEPDDTLIIVLSSDGEHLAIFELDETEGKVDLATYNLDDSASDAVPDDPTKAIANTKLDGTWSGLAFDVEVNSPPAVSTVSDSESMKFNTSGSDLPIANNQKFLGHTLNDDGPATLYADTTGTDMNYGFFWGGYSSSTYFYWLIPSPDLAVIGFIYCSPKGLMNPSDSSYCGDGQGTYDISLMPASGDSYGWGFALLEAQ